MNPTDLKAFALDVAGIDRFDWSGGLTKHQRALLDPNAGPPTLVARPFSGVPVAAAAWAAAFALWDKAHPRQHRLSSTQSRRARRTAATKRRCQWAR